MKIDRLNMNLTEQGQLDLDELTAKGLSKTDVVHRALRLALFVRDAQARGDQILVKNAEGKWREVVLL